LISSIARVTGSASRLFDDRTAGSRRVAHDAPVATRIRDPRRQDGNRRVALRLLVEQGAEQLGGQQRHVGVGHDHVARIVRDALHADPDGVRRAELRILARGAGSPGEGRLRPARRRAR